MVNKIIFSCTCQECDFDMGINLVVQLKYLKCSWVFTDINLIWTCTKYALHLMPADFYVFRYKLNTFFFILYCVVSFSVEMISCLSGLGFTSNINKILWSNSICLITEKRFNGLFDEKYILSNRWNLKENRYH